MHQNFKNSVLIFFVTIMGMTSYAQELSNATALAIKYGNIERLERLIPSENINDCIGVKRSKKYNYLALSIKLKSMKSLKYFVENGADIEGVCANKTPLMYAAQYGQIKMVKYLIENGAQINRSIRRLSAIDYAKQFHHSEIKKLLIASKFN